MDSDHAAYVDKPRSVKCPTDKIIQYVTGNQTSSAVWTNRTEGLWRCYGDLKFLSKPL